VSPPSGWQLPPVEVRQAPPDPVPPRPSTVRAAVALMVLGAVFAAVDVVVELVTFDRDDLERRLARGDVTPGDLDGFVVILLVVGSVLGLVMVGVWILNAVGSARGRGWARTWATVLGGIFVVVSLSALIGSSFGLADAFQLLRMVDAAAAVVLLWLPPSRAFFRAASTRP